MSLSSDLPRTDPSDDLFGHAPFAKQLAKSIARQTADAGLVLALHGPWGSGKTTVLEYVKHYLALDESAKDFAVVDFNPWWFAGRDDLAQAFLAQLAAVLPGISEKLRELGTLIGDFAEGIGGLIDLAGAGGGGAAGKIIGGILKRQPKDVPAIKRKIATKLRETGVRVLVIVDDIDRLDDAEVRQLFTVIKALADFPFVTYLLAFDYAVAAKAIEAASHLPGHRYLEKIIQVPFHLPAVDRVALRSAFFKRLEEILTVSPQVRFDNDYWSSLCYDGIDPLIRVPRDIVRVSNALAVTYPGVAAEVNLVDFIAVEIIRVFLPSLYETLRANPDKFAGHSRAREDREARKQFHEKWAEEIPEDMRPAARALITGMFPKVGLMEYGADWVAEWRRELRACHPDVFPTYFRFSLPSGAVGHSEMMALIGALANPRDFKKHLLAAKQQVRPDGIPKARELLERLMDHIPKDIPDLHVPVAIGALLEIGDQLVEPREQRAMSDPGSEIRIARPLYHLLKRVKREEQRETLERAIRASPGLVISAALLRFLAQEAASPALLAEADVKLLQAVWIERARERVNDLIAHTEFRWVLETWRQWGDPAEVRQKCSELVDSDTDLFLLLHAFLGQVQMPSGRRARRSPRLDPAWLEPFVEVELVANRLVALQNQGRVPDAFAIDVRQFLRERDMRAAGKNPDALRWPDDEDYRGDTQAPLLCNAVALCRSEHVRQSQL